MENRPSSSRDVDRLDQRSGCPHWEGAGMLASPQVPEDWAEKQDSWHMPGWQDDSALGIPGRSLREH